MSPRVATRMDEGHLRGIIGAIAYISLFGISFGLAYPLLAIILERQGVSGVMIGSSATAHAIGALAITPFMPVLMRRAGMSQLLVICALGWMLGFLLLWVYRDPWLWMPIRFMLGALGSIAFFGSEFWIVALAPHGRRGRVVGIYTISVASGFGLGPLILAQVGFDGGWPFIIGSIAVLVSIVPVILVRRQAPHFTGEVQIAEVPRFALLNPSICLAVFLFGMLESGMFGVLPAWGIRAGLTERMTAYIVALAGFGSIVFQLFIGPASDRMNRSILLCGCALGSAVLSVLAAVLVDVTWALRLTVFAWGGISAGLYTVALVELGARHHGRELAVGSAAIIMMYGFGAVGGPPLAGAAMDAIPPHGVLYTLTLASALYAVFVAWRGVMKKRAEVSRTAAFDA